MRILKFAGMFTAVSFLLIACGQGETPKREEPPVSTPPVAKLEGQELFEQKCVQCHGVSGKGDGQAAAALNPKPANLISTKVQAKSDAELVRLVSEGKPGTAMMRWETVLEDKEILDLVKYIRELAAQK